MKVSLDLSQIIRQIHLKVRLLITIILLRADVRKPHDILGLNHDVLIFLLIDDFDDQIFQSSEEFKC